MKRKAKGPEPPPPVAEAEGNAERDKEDRIVKAMLWGDGEQPPEELAQLRARLRPKVRDWLSKPRPAKWARFWSVELALADPELRPDAWAVELRFWKAMHDLHTSNPLFVWHARKLARGAGLPVPDWVEAYLDRATAGILAHRPNGEPTASWLPDAMGFAYSKPALQFANAQRNLDLWYQGHAVAGMIKKRLCPYCFGAQGARCAECKGTGRWSGARKSADVVVAELREAAGDPMKADTIRKIRTSVNKLMAAPI